MSDMSRIDEGVDFSSLPEGEMQKLAEVAKEQETKFLDAENRFQQAKNRLLSLIRDTMDTVAHPPSNTPKTDATDPTEGVMENVAALTKPPPPGNTAYELKPVWNALDRIDPNLSTVSPFLMPAGPRRNQRRGTRGAQGNALSAVRAKNEQKKNASGPSHSALPTRGFMTSAYDGYTEATSFRRINDLPEAPAARGKSTPRNRAGAAASKEVSSEDPAKPIEKNGVNVGQSVRRHDFDLRHASNQEIEKLKERLEMQQRQARENAHKVLLHLSESNPGRGKKPTAANTPPSKPGAGKSTTKARVGGPSSSVGVSSSSGLTVADLTLDPKEANKRPALQKGLSDPGARHREDKARPSVHNEDDPFLSSSNDGTLPLLHQTTNATGVPGVSGPGVPGANVIPSDYLSSLERMYQPQPAYPLHHPQAHMTQPYMMYPHQNPGYHMGPAHGHPPYGVSGATVTGGPGYPPHYGALPHAYQHRSAPYYGHDYGPGADYLPVEAQNIQRNHLATQRAQPRSYDIMKAGLENKLRKERLLNIQDHQIFSHPVPSPKRESEEEHNKPSLLPSKYHAPTAESSQSTQKESFGGSVDMSVEISGEISTDEKQGASENPAQSSSASMDLLAKNKPVEKVQYTETANTIQEEYACESAASADIAVPEEFSLENSLFSKSVLVVEPGSTDVTDAPKDMEIASSSALDESKEELGKMLEATIETSGDTLEHASPSPMAKDESVPGKVSEPSFESNMESELLSHTEMRTITASAMDVQQQIGVIEESPDTEESDLDTSVEGDDDEGSVADAFADASTDVGVDTNTESYAVDAVISGEIARLDDSQLESHGNELASANTLVPQSDDEEEKVGQALEATESSAETAPLVESVVPTADDRSKADDRDAGQPAGNGAHEEPSAPGIRGDIADLVAPNEVLESLASAVEVENSNLDSLKNASNDVVNPHEDDDESGNESSNETVAFIDPTIEFPDYDTLQPASMDSIGIVAPLGSVPGSLLPDGSAAPETNIEESTALVQAQSLDNTE